MAEEFKFTEKQQAAYDVLTDLQRKTVINIARGNMSQRIAYLEAGGRAKTKASADQVVSKMLSMTKVKAFMDSLLEAVAGDAIMTREESLEILSHIGRTKLTDIIGFKVVTILTVNSDGEEEEAERAIINIKESDEIDPIHAHSLSEVTAGKDGLKVKIHSSPAAIKQLAQMEGWDAPTKHEHSGVDGEPIEIAEVTDEERARKLAFLLTKGDLKK